MRISVHVDDPLVIGPEGPIRFLFEWRVAVKSLEILDPVRRVNYLGMAYSRIPGGYLETIPPGYTDGMASMMGVLQAKTPATPAIRTRHPTEADEKPVDPTRVRVCRAIVGKARWILRARSDVLYTRVRCAWTASQTATGLDARRRGSQPREPWCGWVVDSWIRCAGHRDSSPCHHQKRNTTPARRESQKRNSVSPSSSIGEGSLRSSTSSATAVHSRSGGGLASAACATWKLDTCGCRRKSGLDA